MTPAKASPWYHRIGLDDALLAVGLLLTTIGAWCWIGPVALLCPGVALIWLALPSRTPFLLPPPAPPSRRLRED